MLIKLTMANIKSHIRDYIVLLTGLVMSAAIFYMFANLATNQTLIKANINFKFASITFVFGLILLAIITLVYVMYANRFLLNMRQHDYGLFMMLGAKKSRVSRLLVVETLLVGTIATVIGIILGIVVTGGLSGWLFNRLGLTMHHFNPFYPKAVVVTLILFIGLFIVAALMNLGQMIKTPVLKLLKQADTVDRVNFKPVRLVLQTILGIGLLAIGYWAMANVATLVLASIPIALVTITIGSYLVFHAVMLLLLTLIKRTNWAIKGLNGFTLSQIMFRVHDYTKILTVTSLLFAMALGAITVGTGFRRDIPLIAKNSSAYTMAINNPDQNQKRQIKQLTDAQTVTYQQKVTKKYVYYLQSEFTKQPFKTVIPGKDPHTAAKYKDTTTKQLTNNQQYEFGFLAGTRTPLNAKFVSASQFAQLKAKPQRVTMVTVKDIPTNYHKLVKLADYQTKKYPLATGEVGFGAFTTYQLAIGMFGGLEFVGYFLGIAFLAMLASCLMFKILSGATQDQIRYQMLAKIGARQKLLKQSINREILVLFTLPAILGVVDVLFGLQLFKVVMTDPYYQIGWIILIFVLIYLVYYLLTVWLYRLLVLPSKKK
ncbi:FtsX-like permease family protein [Lentilactobacillus senioris]|uniref:FtsX-like permease family protein n=1 Tax=Lentilactobacillus senioris TaxID=931534 RepID=UPI00228324CC|nr:FtsX-like permease family protein [Lentilactobacillus senioris]MCY9807399.1 FtsX-like permease family protein [Lentilactobacillus senioris]